ncbi:MAG: DUF2927 domain-containing protein [Roseinatronobacter sp.]|jgi:hypothetical protein|nr:DUF2927 domain-containing protein [Roseinatronobacter sp.]
MSQSAPHPPPNRARRAALMLGAAVSLAGCEGFTPRMAEPPVATSPAPPPRAIATEIAFPEATDHIRAHFVALEARRLGDGMLRQTRNPADLPFSDRDLEEVFVKIALFDEYTYTGGRIIQRSAPSTLRRWELPVRMGLEFGSSVPQSRQNADRAFVGAYAGRLGRVTGHPVSLVDRGANFHILVLDETERQAIGPRLRQLVPGVDDVTVGLIEDLPLTISCLVLAFSRSGTDVYSDAVAVIRAELPDLSRHACYHEELAQGMGLPNDSPRARPSLFNDTGEFGVLTVMDEQLLRILYDPRLRPGMREREARPIIRRIARELMGGQS